MPRGVTTSRSANRAPKRDLVTRTDGQEYGVVTKLLGNSRTMVKIGKEEKQCTIRGSMRRREWVHVGDFVLVALRDFGEQHDILRRYTDIEVMQLRRLNEITHENVADESNDTDGVDIVFEDL